MICASDGDTSGKNYFYYLKNQNNNNGHELLVNSQTVYHIPRASLGTMAYTKHSQN